MSGKKRNVMLFVLLFTLLLGVIVPVQAQSYGGTKTIRVAYREDADFINKSSSGVYKGYGVEYLNKISQYTGWRYEYINESWENQLADLKSGKVDLICNAQKTEAREKDYDFSCMPVGTEQAVLYTSEDNGDIYFQDYEHMNGKKVGLLRDSYQNEEFEQRQDEKNFHCPEELEVTRILKNYRVMKADNLFQKMEIPLLQVVRVVKMMLGLSVVSSVLVITLLLSMWMRARKKEIAIYVSLGKTKVDLFMQIILECFSVFGFSTIIALYTGDKMLINS